MSNSQLPDNADFKDPASLVRLVDILRALDAVVPEGEGAVSLQLFADGGGIWNFEMWGVLVASGSLGGEIITNRGSVATANPNWLPDVEALVARLNVILSAAVDNLPAAPSTRWPLNVNSEMDKHAADQGLGHWSCVSPSSNRWWVRKDGLEFEAFTTKDTTLGYPEELRAFDARFPIKVHR